MDISVIFSEALDKNPENAVGGIASELVEFHYCKHCGNKILGGSNVCSYCGRYKFGARGFTLCCAFNGGHSYCECINSMLRW